MRERKETGSPMVEPLESRRLLTGVLAGGGINELAPNARSARAAVVSVSTVPPVA